jgi:hypothetical protein
VVRVIDDKTVLGRLSSQVRLIKSAVEPLKSGGCTPVRPSETSIQQRELDQAKVIDIVVKRFSFQEAKIGIVLFMAITNHVEILSDHPQCSQRRRDGFEFSKKVRTKMRRGGSINVSQEHGGISEGRLKMNREGVR